MQLKEMSAKYGESITVLTLHCQRGTLPAVKIRNRWNVTVSDYEAWKAKREQAKEKKINTRQCERCRYSMKFTSGGCCCDYLGKTGMMRNCPTYPVCEKFEPRKKHSRKSAEGM